MLGANRVGPQIRILHAKPPLRGGLTQKKALSDVVALVGPVGPCFYTRGGGRGGGRSAFAPSVRIRTLGANARKCTSILY